MTGLGVRLEIPRPRTDQLRVLQSDARFIVLMCGRRWGKSVLILMICMAAFRDGAKIGLCCPTYQYFDLLWRMLLEILRPLIDAGVCKTNESKKLIWFPGLPGVIEGWSLDSDNPARGRDYDWVIVEEAGMVSGLVDTWNQALRPTLLDRHGRALFVGTPKIVTPDLPTMFKWGQSDEARYSEWKAFSGRSMDNPYLDPKSKADIEMARLSMPEWQFLQEYEGIPSDVITAFFTKAMLDQHKRAYSTDPTFRGTLEIKGESASDKQYALSQNSIDAIKLTSDPFNGTIRLWGPPGRPRQDRTYSLGVDVSAGVGSSNTTMVAIDDVTGEQVLEYADSRVLPERAAQVAHALGVYLGGRDGPCKINPEANGGAGETFVQSLLRGDYPNVVKRKKRGVTYSADASRPEYGFWSDHTSKEAMLSAFRQAMIGGHCQIRSTKLLEECATYQIDDHGRLVSVSISDDPTELASAPHGDRVIAGGLAWDAARMSAPVEVDLPQIPHREVPESIKDKRLTARLRV